MWSSLKEATGKLYKENASEEDAKLNKLEDEKRKLVEAQKEGINKLKKELDKKKKESETLHENLKKIEQDIDKEMGKNKTLHEEHERLNNKLSGSTHSYINAVYHINESGTEVIIPGKVHNWPMNCTKQVKTVMCGTNTKIITLGGKHGVKCEERTLY